LSFVPYWYMFMDFFNLDLHLQRYLELGLRYVPKAALSCEIKLEDFLVKILHGGAPRIQMLLTQCTCLHTHIIYAYPYHA
jgi:hypothetical protein